MRAPLFLTVLLVLGANQSCSDNVAPAIPDQRVGDSSALDLRAREAAADQIARDGATPDAPLPWDSAALDLKEDTKAVKCTKDADCGKLTCAASGSNDCSQTQPACNLATGLCLVTSSVVKNAFCESATGLCKALPPSCKVDSDCGVPTCATSGSACTQTSPKCINGQCSKSNVIVQNAVCDSGTGLCTVTGPGVCKVDLDCGKPTCANATNSTCTQTKPTCTNNLCKTIVTSLQNAVCDATTGLCK